MIFRGMVSPRSLAMECAQIWTQSISLTLGLVGLYMQKAGRESFSMAGQHSADVSLLRGTILCPLPGHLSAH